MPLLFFVSFACLLSSPPAHALGIDKYVGYYDVVAELTEPDGDCPLRTARIERGYRAGMEGIFLEARGNTQSELGRVCHASVALALSLEAAGIKCEDQEDGVSCKSGNNHLEVKIKPAGASTLVFTIKGTGENERFLSLLLKRSGRSL